MLVSLLGVAPAASEPYAYVANEAAGTVSVIDTQTDKVTSTLKVGDKPRGITASVDGARLYIAHDTGTLIEHDLYRDKNTARITVGRSAKAIQPSPDGKSLSIVVDDGVVLIDMATLRVTKTIRIDDPNVERATFSPDGRWIYANAKEGDSIRVIDVVSGSLSSSIKVGRGATSIGFLPDGSRAYAVVGDEIVAIDVARREVVARAKSPGGLGDAVVHPDGKRVFVSAVNAGSVLVFDSASNRFIASVKVGDGPSDMALTADGGKLYVACRGSNDVSVIDTATYKRIEDIHVGARPSGIVVSEPPTLPRDGD